MARNAARLKLGYYPLVENEAKRIRQFLQFPETCAALDPCAGTGRALALVAADAGVRLYGIRRSRYERERLKDRDFQAQRNFLSYAAGAYPKISQLRDTPDRIYTVPAGPAAVRLMYNGLPFDAIEDLLPSSRAYREAVR